MSDLKQLFKETFGFSPVKKPVVVKPRKPRKLKISEVKVPSRKSLRIEDKELPLGFYCDQNLELGERKKNKSRASVEDSVEVTMYTSNMSESTADSFQCLDCEKKFKFKNSLMKHINAVHSKTRFSCHVCFSTFSYRANRKRHVALEHETNPSINQCKDCNQTFTYKHNLKSHLKKFHEHEM